MRTILKITLTLIICCLTLTLIITGLQSYKCYTSFDWNEKENCSLCKLKEQITTDTKLEFRKYLNKKKTQSESEPWSIYECYTTPEGNCELCIHTLDHDGDGPKPAEVHLWFFCDGKLVWHVWCEDTSDPSKCKCLDGCTMDSLPIGFQDIQDLISNKP